MGNETPLTIEQISEYNNVQGTEHIKRLIEKKSTLVLTVGMTEEGIITILSPFSSEMADELIRALYANIGVSESKFHKQQKPN